MPVRMRLGLLFRCCYVPSCGLKEAPGGKSEGMGGNCGRGRAPLLGAVLGSNGLEEARHGFLLEHTIKILVMTQINELLCVRVGRHILMLS